MATDFDVVVYQQGRQRWFFLLVTDSYEGNGILFNITAEKK